ncbi:DUF3566 domain-containing protein [Sporichthya sp.]|uniref:DUF3566 domain-containing protein n=1 Tax=Sporichthya sp. TaxID=65475 RepID=UPI001851B092|nr:DUF3566 domain-containing protein [Sporichthya sp.]MBA3741698.1 DUF3566 domain-containing protein [Sporichthya sp.]
MSSKEGRGGRSRFGIGRKSDAENQGEDGGESGAQMTATADKADKRGSAQAEIVTAPAVTDGDVFAPAKPVSMSAPVSASASSSASGAPVNASVNASGNGSAPSKAGAAVVDAPDKPVKKVPLAPSRAALMRDKPEPNKSDAPIPRSRLGRTKGSDAIRAPRVRRARLKIANIDPWSVMKVSFLFSVALGVILLVAVALLWLLLDFMGFFSTVASTVDDISGEEGGSSGFDVVAFFSLPRVLGMATIVALIDIVMITALTTLCAYLYNISTDLVGGVEVTLAEEE